MLVASLLSSTVTALFFALQPLPLDYNIVSSASASNFPTLSNITNIFPIDINKSHSEHNSIVTSLKIIADNSSSPKGWDLFLYFGSAVLGGGIAIIAQWFFQKRADTKEKAKIREEQISKINAVLVSFHCMIDTLSLLKDQFIEPYKNEVKTITEAPDDDKKNVWYGLKKFKEYYALQTFDETIYTKDLEFIFLESPTYFITFHKCREHLLQINPTISTRNSYLQREQEQFRNSRELNMEQIKDMIVMHSTTCDQLEHFVNNTWLLLLCGIDHLEDYAKKFFKQKAIYRHALIRNRVSELDAESEEFRRRYMETIQDT